MKQPRTPKPVRSSELVRRRHEHNETVLVKCVAIMREHDQRAVMANFARCGCEFCKVVRHYEPPNVRLNDGENPNDTPMTSNDQQSSVRLQSPAATVERKGTMVKSKTTERKSGAAGRGRRVVSQPTRIEQPSSVTGRRWFFARGYAGGFGAEYGPTLDKRTVAARCQKKAGAGKLVNIKGVWHWLANEKVQTRRD